MKTGSCGWRTLSLQLGRRAYGDISQKARLKDEAATGILSYMDYVANAASFEAYTRSDPNPLLSAETNPDIRSLIDFKAFAHDYPDKLFPLLAKLRPEFQEFFIEYYLLEKSQSFIGRVHGQIQTRVWQALRLIEQAIGSLILLGPNPDYDTLHSILVEAGLDTTSYGMSLTEMILYYAASQSYAVVAHKAASPVSAIRKIFRPAIAALLENKDVKAIAVGAYLRSLTHRASLRGTGLSKRCIARTRRVKELRFDAPPSDESPLLSFGATSTLGNIPWSMLEISSEHRMIQIAPLLKRQGKKIFGKLAAQIFAPVNSEGELTFGYIFARCTTPSKTRALTRIRGICELAAIYNDDGRFKRLVLVPHSDVQIMMQNLHEPDPPAIRLHDFVEILTGPANRYCGTVIRKNAATEELTVQVQFPTERSFIVRANVSCVRLLPKTPKNQRTFWGTNLLMK